MLVLTGETIWRLQDDPGKRPEGLNVAAATMPGVEYLRQSKYLEDSILCIPLNKIDRSFGFRFKFLFAPKDPQESTVPFHTLIIAKVQLISHKLMAILNIVF
jgi:hypothetical protein